jgi:hypothetical protein
MLSATPLLISACTFNKTLKPTNNRSVSKQVALTGNSLLAFPAQFVIKPGMPKSETVKLYLQLPWLLPTVLRFQILGGAIHVDFSVVGVNWQIYISASGYVNLPLDTSAKYEICITASGYVFLPLGNSARKDITASGYVFLPLGTSAKNEICISASGYADFVFGCLPLGNSAKYKICITVSGYDFCLGNSANCGYHSAKPET